MRFDGEAKRTERGRPFAQREPRRLPEQVRAGDVGDVAGIRRGKFGRIDAFFGNEKPIKSVSPL